MEVQRYGLNYKIKSPLPRSMVLIVLISFREKVDSYELIGGSSEDDEINFDNPYEYQVNMFFNNSISVSVTDITKWVNIMDDFLKSLRLIQNIVTLRPNKE